MVDTPSLSSTVSTEIEIPDQENSGNLFSTIGCISPSELLKSPKSVNSFSQRNSSFNRSLNKKSLIDFALVVSISDDISEWIQVSINSSINSLRGDGDVTHNNNTSNDYSIENSWVPQIINSIPSDKDASSQLFSLMLTSSRMCFPTDVKIIKQLTRPNSTWHSFVIQINEDNFIFGVCLIAWTEISDSLLSELSDCHIENDDNRIYNNNNSNNNNYNYINKSRLWKPSAICIASHAPLFGFLSDFLKYMSYDHLQNADFNSVLNSAKMSEFLSISMSHSDKLFDLKFDHFRVIEHAENGRNYIDNLIKWPIFECLSLSNIITVFEQISKPDGKILLFSQTISSLTIVAEFLRIFCQGWKGLYVPVAPLYRLQILINEPGSYIIGVPSSPKELFSIIPKGILLVDLDHNFIIGEPEKSTSFSHQRFKKELLKSLKTVIAVSGFPDYLQDAFPCNRIAILGSLLDSLSDNVVCVETPSWWNREDMYTIFSKHYNFKPKRYSSKEEFIRQLNLQSFEASKYSMESYDALLEIQRLKKILIYKGIRYGDIVRLLIFSIRKLLLKTNCVNNKSTSVDSLLRSSLGNDLYTKITLLSTREESLKTLTYDIESRELDELSKINDFNAEKLNKSPNSSNYSKSSDNFVLKSVYTMQDLLTTLNKYACTSAEHIQEKSKYLIEKLNGDIQQEDLSLIKKAASDIMQLSFSVQKECTNITDSFEKFKILDPVEENFKENTAPFSILDHVQNEIAVNVSTRQIPISTSNPPNIQLETINEDKDSAYEFER